MKRNNKFFFHKNFYEASKKFCNFFFFASLRRKLLKFLSWFIASNLDFGKLQLFEKFEMALKVNSFKSFSFECKVHPPHKSTIQLIRNTTHTCTKYKVHSKMIR